MASPSLGGILSVPLELCKKWDLDLENEIFRGEEVFDDPEESVPQEISGEEDKVMNQEEQAQLGFYNVFKILKHKFHQGWKFLVWWENFPMAASTWEPISAFVLPNGSVNSVFK